MAYNIIDIRKIDPDSYPRYFIDSNVWIALLESLGFSSEPRFEPYLTFFEGIVSLNIETDPKLLKKIRNKPNIIVTSLLLSEIFNGFMRQVAMKVYYSIEATKNGPLTQEEIEKYIRKFEFKRDYRKTNDYSEKLGKLKSNFKAYKNYIDFRDDNFTELGPISLVDSISDDADFNDFYYYYSLAPENIPIITDDHDFIFQDIPIITANKRLLDIMKK